MGFDPSGLSEDQKKAKAKAKPKAKPKPASEAQEQAQDMKKKTRRGKGFGKRAEDDGRPDTEAELSASCRHRRSTGFHSPYAHLYLLQMALFSAVYSAPLAKALA